MIGSARACPPQTGACFAQNALIEALAGGLPDAGMAAEPDGIGIPAAE